MSNISSTATNNSLSQHVTIQISHIRIQPLPFKYLLHFLVAIWVLQQLSLYLWWDGREFGWRWQRWGVECRCNHSEVEVSITSRYQAHQTYLQHTVMLILTCIALFQILYRLITKGSLQREAEMSRSVISV
jgi:hypothetical protein